MRAFHLPGFYRVRVNGVRSAVASDVPLEKLALLVPSLMPLPT